eukprot:gb/GEZN01009168.1/.p1 GENE.gb/GEZN01009168.1/~~gb/GEZN01009168.1/.p1  ORF type:complete len:149 (+),score=7.43 gb/GEZN01009168.1/:598-1044(+)
MGTVPDDDVIWRGSFQGTVRCIFWCGRVLLEGQVNGIGPGMRKYAERRLGNTAFSEVLFPVFRLPVGYRPRKVESFSRRPLDIGSRSSDFIGGYADGSLGYRPLRRIDVLPSGFVVLVACLHVKTELHKALQRISRWIVTLRGIDFFP